MSAIVPISIYERFFGIKRYHVDGMMYTFKDNSNQCGAILTLVDPKTSATYFGCKITNQIVGIIEKDTRKLNIPDKNILKHRLTSWVNKMDVCT